MTWAKGAQCKEQPNSAPPGSWLTVCLLLLLFVVGPAWAQAQRPVITVVPARPVASATSATQVPFLIKIGPSGAVPRGSFVKVRGLPTMAALSAGYSIAPGSWAVPLAALPNLKIMLPAAAAGSAEISIVLLATDGSILAETNYLLVVGAPPPAEGRATSDAAPPGPAVRVTPLQVVPEPAPAASPMAAAERERALRLMKKGDEQLAEGGIAQARLLYERAAEAGLAQGAMAVAATFDPAEFERLGVRGLKPDRQAARKWYERARQMGARKAAQRLRRLDAN